MKKWEYKSVTIKKITDMVEFNEVGENGWELVSVIPTNVTGGFKGIFKREIIQEKPKDLLVD